MSSPSQLRNSVASSKEILRSIPDDRRVNSLLRQALIWIGVAVVYYAAAKLGLQFAYIHSHVSPIWPPTGIAIAALLLFGNRVAPAIFVAAFFANANSPVGVAAALAIASGNTLEALIGKWLLHVVKFDLSFSRARDVLKFVVVAVVCTMVSATIGTLALCVSNAAQWSQFGSLWVTWWLGDLAGAVTVGPLVIAWVKRLGVQLAGWRLFEAVLLLVLLSVAAVVTYGDSAPAALRYYPLTRLIIPFSIWAAFRLGYRGLTLSTVLVSLFAAWGTVRGNGPFVTVWGANESLIVLQLFISTNAVTFLFLASVLEERRLAKESQSSTDTVLRHLASIVENTDDVVIGRDLNGLVMSWNAAAERLYGYKAEEMIGQPVSILIPPDRPNEEPEILARLSQGERIDHYETVRKAKDGRLIEVSLTVSPIKDAVGKIIGYSKIARDITDRRRAEAEREALLKSEHEARAQAEEANRVKDEFLAVLSHELRTPLNAILGWANLLRSGKLDPQNVERALEIVERNAKAQSKLIEGVLDVSRIVSGKLQLDVRPLQLSGVVQAAVDSIRPAADAKNTMLRVITSKQVEPLVRGDASRLQQVVWNLLSNAVKFSPAGSEISVGLNTVNSDVEITVRDNGQGIAEDFLPHVFDRFRQADASTTRKHGGLGLGLAIVRHLVDLHGGTVTAESDGLGRGATFRVRLKAIDTAVTPVSITTEEPAETARASLLGLKVLVVDDHEDGREVLAEMLSMCDAQVRVASSASEAFEVVQSWQPQVIVSDISMPDVDGYGFIRQLRALDGTVAIPAIAVTAHALPEDRERALAAGFQNHVAKPIQLSELILTIAKLTDRDKI